jgi:hypothetical protein
MKMIELAHALKLPRGTILFALAALVVIALASAGPAAAQRGLRTNTGLGEGALSSITTGTDDTALGFDALKNNTSGLGNTATGANSLLQNTIGINNTANGLNALESNTSGSNNTAIGLDALLFNTGGAQNTAVGVNAAEKNTTGFQNTAIGTNALFSNTTGVRNIAVGLNAGINITTGSDNIVIGNAGRLGDNDTIRIGTQFAHAAAFIAGIYGAAVTGADVSVNASGQLGISPSSARFKHDIRDLGEASRNLMNLRPVSFRYNFDPAETVQYGLVAEEVAKIYPELVANDPDGKALTVRYSMLGAMLLNELQKQLKESDRQARQIERLTARLVDLEISKRRELEAQKAAFEERLSKLEHMVKIDNGN